MSSKSIKSVLFVALALFTLIAASPTKNDIPDDIAKSVSENLKYYVIGIVAMVCVIIALLCWTAAKGCCCLIKIGLLVGCGLVLFFLIFKGTTDYTKTS